MKIPNDIEKALNARAKAAREYLSADCKIVKFLSSHNISVDEGDILTGALALCEPFGSVDRVRSAILEKEEKND